MCVFFFRGWVRAVVLSFTATDRISGLSATDRRRRRRVGLGATDRRRRRGGEFIASNRAMSSGLITMGACVVLTIVAKCFVAGIATADIHLIHSGSYRYTLLAVRIRAVHGCSFNVSKKGARTVRGPWWQFQH